MAKQVSLGSNWLQSIRGLRDHTDLASALSPGTYIAVLDKSPFIERPLDGAAVEDTAAIVFGISKEQADGR